MIVFDNYNSFTRYIEGKTTEEMCGAFGTCSLENIDYRIVNGENPFEF